MMVFTRQGCGILIGDAQNLETSRRVPWQTTPCRTVSTLSSDSSTGFAVGGCPDPRLFSGGKRRT
jgi:hypothetical protein